MLPVAGLSDFSEAHVVVVVGGCEGSAVLGVVDLQAGRIAHKLQLRGTHPPVPLAYSEGGCEVGTRVLGIFTHFLFLKMESLNFKSKAIIFVFFLSAVSRLKMVRL